MLRPFVLKPNICQDRLRTDIGKVEGKGVVCRMIAAATPLGGDFTTLWYRAAPTNGNGSAFIALNNGPSKVVEERAVSLAGYHQLPAAEQFEVVLWDGLELFSRVTSGTGAALSKQVFKTALEPNSTRVFAFVPPGVLL